MMKDTLGFVERRIARIRALTATEDPRAYIGKVLDHRIAEATAERPMGISAEPFLPSQRLLASARYSVENLEDPKKLLSRPEGIVDLGTIEWCLRPALPIIGGKISPPASAPWNELRSDEVAHVSAKICRIDIAYANSETFHLGTGFVLGGARRGRFFITTNAHVVTEAVRLGWPADSSINLLCDFDRTSVDIGGPLYRLCGEYSIHERYDLAVLYLEATDELQDLEIGSLKVASRAPDPEVGTKVGVLGHPHFDSRRDMLPMHFGFGDQYGIKRFSPGLIRAVQVRQWLAHEVEVFLHDATTLSGSSGSCVMSLETKEVLGLHFGGWPMPPRRVSTKAGDLVASLFEANGAVPLWRIAQDPIFGRD